MSDSASPPPPGDNPAESRISDRAALEAALVGAAGLLLGRVLLGRGFGLLAGSAAIAARLLTDAASKKSAPDAGDAPAGPSPEPAAPEGLPDEPAGVRQEAGPFSTLTVPAIPPGPAPLSADLIKEENPFANLFAEAPPDAGAVIPVHVSPFQPEPPTTTSPPPERVEAGPDLAFPAFPDLEDALPPEKPAASAPASQPAPDSSPLPGLSDFPDPTTPLPHPDEIWKMAAEESAPIAEPPPAPFPSPALVTGAFPLPFAFPPAAETDPAPPLPGEPPFFPLSPAPEPGPAEPPAAEALHPNSAEESIPAFPPIVSFQAPVAMMPAGITEPATGVSAPPPLEPPTAGEFPAAAQPDTLPEAPLPPDVAALPLLSLKVKAPASSSPPPAFTPQAAPASAEPPPAPVATPPEPALDVIPEPAVDPAPGGESIPTTAPESIPVRPVPMRATTAWILLLLLAAGLTWLYRHEMKKADQARATLPAPTQSLLPPQPPVAPVTPPPVVPTPQKTPVPVPPAPLPPKPPGSTPPAKNTTPVPTPPPSASLIAPPVYAEPLAGVPQDFPPASLEARSRQVLERLLDAATANEAKPLIHDPGAALKQAAVWFPDGKLRPAPWKRIIFDSSDKLPRSAYKASFFRVVTEATPLGFPVAVEDTKDGPLIDFNAFVQCRDRLLDTFISSPGKPAHPFLVILRRGHYFGDDLTPAELEQLICFEITAPNPGSVKHRVFIPRGSDLGTLAVKKFVWDKTYTPVVELTHAGKHVEITAILRDVWRSIPP